ncbi:hypothetical protein LCGC14_1457020 [marine sediment metagenome]|uniref:Nmd3 N-terminal domain-containing protein n=1 Tax=marine sediment metagenome TaxID=412755 RepID=A0A0F9LWV8_9ZZZZ
MPNKFCAICGKNLPPENNTHFGFCFDCYLSENPLFELPEGFSFNICFDCGSYSKKEVWSEASENDTECIISEALQKYLLNPIRKKNKINFSIFFDKESYIFSSKDLLISLKVKINGSLIQNSNIKHIQVLKLKLNYILCKNCSNLRGGTYFLTILQLRVKNERQFDLIKEIINEINAYVEKIFKINHKHYISKIEDQKYGVDLYLSTNEIMKYIIKFLKAKYHFLLKRSKKLIGRDSQKGRNVYRLKTLIKFLPIASNDIILIRDQKYLIENITKNKVILRRENNTKLIKDYSYFFNEKVVKFLN